MMKSLLLVLIPLVVVGCSERTDLCFVTDATMGSDEVVEENEYIKNRRKGVQLLLNGHYISSGANLVLLVRKWHRGAMLDTAGFEKLTVEIKAYESGVPIRMDSGYVRLYYSTGGSPWSYGIPGTYASKATGTIAITDLRSGKLRVSLDISVLRKPNGILPGISEERKLEIREDYRLRRVPIDRLTPWLGVPDISIFKEVYPTSVLLKVIRFFQRSISARDIENDRSWREVAIGT